MHALNIIARYLRGHGGADGGDGSDIAEALESVQVKLDGVERGRERVEAQLDELCCLGAIRGK